MLGERIALGIKPAVIELTMHCTGANRHLPALAHAWRLWQVAAVERNPNARHQALPFQTGERALMHRLPVRLRERQLNLPVFTRQHLRR